MAEADGEPGEPELRQPSPFDSFSVLPGEPASQRRARQLSLGLLLVGLAITIYIAILAATQNATISALLAFLAGVLQVASVWVGQVSGKPDKNLVRHLSRRLAQLGRRMGSTAAAAEAALLVADSDPQRTRELVGRLSVELSYTHEAVGELLETWRDLNPELFTLRSDDGQD